MAQVRWTLGAASDLEEIANFLSVASEASATVLVEEILTRVSSLEGLPRLGRVVPEYQMERLRELIVREYRVVYIVDPVGDSVRIYAIQHGRRDMRQRLGDEPWEEN